MLYELCTLCMLLPDELQEAMHEGGMHVCLGLLLPCGTVYFICSTTDWQCQACKHQYGRGRLGDDWAGMSWGERRNL